MGLVVKENRIMNGAFKGFFVKKTNSINALGESEKDVYLVVSPDGTAGKNPSLYFCVYTQPNSQLTEEKVIEYAIDHITKLAIKFIMNTSENFVTTEETTEEETYINHELSFKNDEIYHLKRLSNDFFENQSVEKCLIDQIARKTKEIVEFSSDEIVDNVGRAFKLYVDVYNAFRDEAYNRKYLKEDVKKEIDNITEAERDK